MPLHFLLLEYSGVIYLFAYFVLAGIYLVYLGLKQCLYNFFLFSVQIQVTLYSHSPYISSSKMGR